MSLRAVIPLAFKLLIVWFFYKEVFKIAVFFSMIYDFNLSCAVSELNFKTTIIG